MTFKNIYLGYKDWENTKCHFKISFPHENEAVKHDLVEFKVQCLKVFCYYGNTSTIFLFNAIFRTTPEVSIKLYFVKVSLREVMAFQSQKSWFFGFQILDSFFTLQPL